VITSEWLNVRQVAWRRREDRDEMEPIGSLDARAAARQDREVQPSGAVRLA
jgi:hypothetical protein